MFEALESRPTGLRLDEARERLTRFGPNRLPRPRRRAWYLKLASNVLHLFAILLWVGSALAWLAGMPQLGIAIVVVVIVNGLFGFWKEYQAERAVEALEALLPHEVTVRRDGDERSIPASDVVPGDVVLLSDLQAISADARVVAADRLRVDMSSLTGESRPAPRSAASSGPVDGTAARFPNLVFAGTAVVAGRGEAVVYATGAATEFGRISLLTAVQDDRPSPLQVELVRVTRLVTALSIAFGVAFFVAARLLGGLSAAASFVFAIGIIVANVPEGLLPTLTLALAAGVRRMAARKALVKRLSAVETLGATTVIVTDKTGTLTENEMTVREAWVRGASVIFEGTGYERAGVVRDAVGATAAIGPGLFRMMRAAALCCDARMLPPDAEHRRWEARGDPTEAAVLVAAAKAGLDRDVLAAWPRVVELPFDSVRKRMTTVQRIEGEAVACMKGAASEVLPRCARILVDGAAAAFDERHRREVEAKHDAMARRGLRVLAVADRRLEGAWTRDGEPDADAVESELTLLGLIAMEDPPRPEVPAALAACRRAGIRAVMVTGDGGLTAEAVGREIGMLGDEARVVTGAELDGTDDAALDAVLKDGDVVFARVTPEHKLRLVMALQRLGEVVAVTGDGVNDAPALKRADIGVAMGATGTDVAREASDIVLADDNFASIVAAVEEGRAVYDNVRKFVTYIFASNIPEMVPFAAFVLFRIPLALTVMQVLAVDLGTDMVPALALGMEPPEPDVMGRRPRRRSERLLDRRTLLRAYCWLGVLEAVFAMAAFFAANWLAGWSPGELLPGAGPAYTAATTACFAAIVMCQVGNLFACRSDRRSTGASRIAANPMLLVGIAVELGLLATLVYVPPIASTFGFSPLGSREWAVIVWFGPALLLLEELRKWWTARS